MLNRVFRTARTALPLAIAATLTTTLVASAQVASLAGPDETPAPEDPTADLMVEFEDREEALLAYAQCMRDNGIDMDDPTLGEGGGGRVLGLGARRGGEGQIDRFGEDFGEARLACGSILEAALPEIDPVAEQERLEEQLLLAQCIRDNGYPQYPDPTMGENGRLQRGAGQEFETLGIDRRSEAFREVLGACRDEIGLAAFGPGGGAGGLGPGPGGN